MHSRTIARRFGNTTQAAPAPPYSQRQDWEGQGRLRQVLERLNQPERRKHEKRIERVTFSDLNSEPRCLL